MLWDLIPYLILAICWVCCGIAITKWIYVMTPAWSAPNLWEEIPNLYNYPKIEYSWILFHAAILGPITVLAIPLCLYSILKEDPDTKLPR